MLKAKSGKNLLRLLTHLTHFLFVPNHTTHKGAHIRDAVDLKRTMVTVIIALLPALIYGIYNTGYQYFHPNSEKRSLSIDAFIHGSWKIVPMIIVSYVVGSNH